MGGTRQLAAPPCPTGILIVDKPAGPTSFDVVSRVKRALRADRAGHTGTLDPAATGVLAVCVGDAVKLQQFLTEGDKAYEATVAFGAATDTEDAEGTVIATGDASTLTPDAIRAALPRFVGDIQQVPPMYSAVRVGGRRLHEAARAGEALERLPRGVRVDALELRGVAPGPGGLLHARVDVRCGKGTYVRTLAADLGGALGVPAHLAALRRTLAGPFRLTEAVPLAEIERLGASDRPALAARLVPMADALRSLAAFRLEARQVRDLAHGRAVACEASASGLARALDEGGQLVAVCEARAGVLRPVRVLARPPSRPER